MLWRNEVLREGLTKKMTSEKKKREDYKEKGNDDI